MKQNKILAGLITTACLILVILMSLRGFNTNKGIVEPNNKQSQGTFDIPGLIDAQEDKLEDPQKNYLGSIQSSYEQLNTDKQNPYLFYLARFWDSIGYPFAAGYYYEKMAIAEPGAIAYQRAADAYFIAASDQPDSVYRNLFFDEAIKNYKKVLELDASILSAKTRLGICYAEVSEAPMQGISLLREVISTDSNNVEAIFALGILSVRSNQYDKALQRFEKLVSLQPLNPDYHFQVGDVYRLMGNNDKALESFNKAMALSKDENFKKELSNIINTLKTN